MEIFEALKNRTKEEAQKYFDNIKSTKINIGFIGQSGAGKSSLINALCGLYPNDKDAADTNIIECTKVPKPYPHPNNENILLWDLPGVSPIFPFDTYFDDIKNTSKFKDYLDGNLVDLDKPIEYDMFIICCKDRFHETDVKMVQELIKFTKNCFLVRTNMDITVENWETKNDCDIDADSYSKLVDLIIGNIEEIFNRCQLLHKKRLFLVSCLMNKRKKIDNRNKFDFPKLQSALEDSDLSEAKKNTLILAIVPMVKEAIESKYNVLKDRLKYSVMLSATAGLIPIPGTSLLIDIAIITNEICFYVKSLNFTQSSINELANAYGVDSNHLFTHAIEKSELIKLILTFTGSFELQQKLMGIFPSSFMLNSVEEYTKNIPVVGSIIGCTVSAFTTYYILQFILEVIKKAYLDIIDYCEKNRRDKHLEYDNINNHN